MAKPELNWPSITSIDLVNTLPQSSLESCTLILNVLILKKVLFFSYINQILPAILSSFEIIWILFAISFISYRIGYFKNI